MATKKQAAELEESAEIDVPEILGDPSAWETIYEYRLRGDSFVTKRFKLTNGFIYYTETLRGDFLSTSTVFVPS